MKTIIISINNKRVILECYRSHYFQIEFTDSNLIEELTIRHNYSVTLNEFDFFRFKHLKNLYIESLHLLSIYSETFKYLYFLEDLYLEAPSLSEFPRKTLIYLTRLKKLQLILNVRNLNRSTFLHNGNLQHLKIIAKISKFETNHIRNLKHIKTLSIENSNNVGTILSKLNIFKHNSLKSIKLYGTTCNFSQFHRDLTKIIINKSYIYNFRNLMFYTKLTYLDLRDCYNVIKIDIIRDNLIKLRTLILSKNFISFFGKNHLRKLKKIIHLDLSHCYILFLDDNFLGVSNKCPINCLILKQNNINKLDCNVLKNCFRLKTFDLSNNQLYFIHNNAFENLINLNELHLQNNKLKIIPNHLFSNLKALRSLNISNNYIEQIISDWFNFSIDYNLQILNLSNNLINEIGDKSLAMFKNLLKLNLCRNFLISIKINYFHNLYNLIELNLSFNKIQIIRTRDFENLKYLEILLLHSNKITTISQRAFTNLIRLKVLNLQHNFIKKLDNNLLRTNKQLQILNLSSNLMKEFSQDFFSNAEQLEILYLNNNEILSNLNRKHFENNNHLKFLYTDRKFERNLKQLPITINFD